MFLQWIEPDGFLSFGQCVRLEVGGGLTVVTGPNGAGKSNLGRCLELARAVVGRATSDPVAERLGVYEDAGYEGAGSFTVRLGIELDQQWERELVWAFVCACFATVFPVQTRPDARSAEDLDEVVRAWLERDPPEDQDNFAEWRGFWERAGVFTLADQFGDDGNKGGEFEAFLERVDPVLLEQARQAGGRSKPRRGAFFAVNHPEPPKDVMDLYAKIAAWLQLGDVGAGPVR